jgi:ribonuclease HI
MKKKHLRSLVGLENWLKKLGLFTSELESSFLSIKQVLESIPEEREKKDESLPRPIEISGEPFALALYSDGGCRGNPGPGAYAYLVQDHGGAVLAQGVEFESLTTNNKMELGGVIKGLIEIRETLPFQGKDPLLTKVKVMTDSKYVVEGMKSWVTGWKAKGWKKADGKSPENLDLWQELDLLRNSFVDIEWVWVKGHGGHPQNEYCDRKANEAMDEHLR